MLSNHLSVDTSAMRASAKYLDASSNAADWQAARLLRCAADELDQVRTDQVLVIIQSPFAPEQLLERAGIPLGGVMEARADADCVSVYNVEPCS